MAYSHYTTGEVSPESLIKAGTTEAGSVNNLIYNLYYEQERRSVTPTTSSPAIVSSNSNIRAATFQQLYNAIMALKTVTGMTYVEVGDVIKASHYNGFKQAIDYLYTRCICQCNYCACQCDNCTCNCDYCACNCNYACTCDCFYSTCRCNCNYCKCACNYECTCNCNDCVCNCNYCTCNVN